MKPGFSEFSYGFALSYEVMRALQPDAAGAPLFPSLVASAGAGADVSFVSEGFPVFLQFKLAEYLMTSRATQWPTYGAAYFRVTVPSRTRTNQHNLLRELSAHEPDVYYAVPAFFQQVELNQAFLSGDVLYNSRFFPLRELPDLVDDEEHIITFRWGEPGFHWHSEQGQRFGIDASGKAWLEGLRQKVSEPRELGAGYFVQLGQTLVRLLREHTLQPDLFLDRLPSGWGDLEPAAVLRDLRYLLVTYFGVEAIVLAPV